METRMKQCLWTNFRMIHRNNIQPFSVKLPVMMPHYADIIDAENEIAV